MKVRNKFWCWIGILILFVLLVSYFWKVEVESGVNFVVEDRLLGILIFHNAFVLGLYVLVAIFIILSSIRKVRLRFTG